MDKQTKKLFHWRPFFYSFLILTLAISSAKFLFDGKALYIVFVCAVLVFLLGFLLWRKRLACLLILLAVFGFGLGWYFLGLQTFAGQEYSTVCQIEGRVSDDITYSKYENSFSVVLKNVKINGKKSKNISLNVEYESKNDIKIGDVISFSAKPTKIKPFKLQKFQSFYYRDNVAYSAEVSSKDTLVLRNKMTVDEKIRQKVHSKLSSTRNGGIMYAVLFGDKSEISSEVKETFQSAGVVHLLTVSGLHVSFLIALLSFVLKKCRAKGWFNFAICSGFVIFYAFLCGFSPSILRAGIMGLALCFANAFGKRYDGLNTLGLAGCLILLVRPLFALDLGFLMSFFCVFGIFALCPLFERLFERVMPKRIAKALAVALSAQIGVFPFAIQINSGLNFLSIFANLIIIPIFSIVYPILFVGVLLTLFLPFMSFIIKGTDFGFVAICKLAEFFGGTKLIANVEPFNIFAIAFGGIFVLCLSRFFIVSKKTKSICCSILLCLCCVGVVLPEAWEKPDAGISVCYEYSKGVILLSNKSHESVIIDVGSEDFTKQLLRISKVDEVSAVFVLQSSKVKIDTVRGIGCKNLIRTGGGEGYAEETLFELDESGQVGGFSFRYRSDKDKMIGLEVSFDDKTLFFVRERYTTVDDFEEIGQENFDFVVLGKNANVATKFQKTSNFASFYQQKSEYLSFEKNGNMNFLLRKNKFVGREID